MNDSDSHIENVNRYDLLVLEKGIFARLDGHGKNIDSIWQEIKEVRKDQKEALARQDALIEKIAEKLQNTRDVCKDRHSATNIKVVGVSAIISSVITAIGVALKLKPGGL